MSREFDGAAPFTLNFWFWANDLSGKQGADPENFTNDVTPLGTDRYGIGALVRNSVLNYFNGRIAEAAVWNGS
jgi:hypothetical protein